MAGKPRKAQRNRRSASNEHDGDLFKGEPVWLEGYVPKDLDVILAYNLYNSYSKDILFPWQEFIADHFRKTNNDELATFLDSYDMSNRLIASFGYLCRMMDRGRTLGPFDKFHYEKQIKEIQKFYDLSKVEDLDNESFQEDTEVRESPKSENQIGLSNISLRKKKVKKEAAAGPVKEKQGVKYHQRDEATGVESISPTRINNSLNVWFFNVKYNTFGYWNSKNGLKFKGQTIEGFDTALCKKLRKPLETMALFKNCTRASQIQKLWDDLTTNPHFLGYSY